MSEDTATQAAREIATGTFLTLNIEGDIIEGGQWDIEGMAAVIETVKTGAWNTAIDWCLRCINPVLTHEEMRNKMKGLKVEQCNE